MEIYKDLYQKENLTFDEILILLNNNYDPDKKLLLKVMEYFVNEGHLLCEYITFCDIVGKLLDKYEDIKTNDKYLIYACDIKNVEIIKMLINKNVRIPICLDKILKYFKHNDEILIKVIGQILSYEDKDKYIERIYNSSYTDEIMIKVIEQIMSYEDKDKYIEFIFEHLCKSSCTDENIIKLYNWINNCKNPTQIIKYIILQISNEIIKAPKYVIEKFIICILKSNIDLCVNMLNEIKKIIDIYRCAELTLELIKNKIIPPNDFILDGETPATFMIKSHINFDKLKDCGLDFNLKNKKGETPFNIAIKHSYFIYFIPYITKKMLELGANPYIKDSNDENVIDILNSISTNSYRRMYVREAKNIIWKAFHISD
ncbi:MAG: ankyrin repeat domain-containing protein [Candidatus Micrarchaeaceae archaeon]